MVGKASHSCKGGEPDCKDACEDFHDGLEENDYSERGLYVAGSLTGLFKDDTIGILEGGQVVPEGY